MKGLLVPRLGNIDEISGNLQGLKGQEPRPQGGKFKHVQLFIRVVIYNRGTASMVQHLIPFHPVEKLPRQPGRSIGDDPIDHIRSTFPGFGESTTRAR